MFWSLKKKKNNKGWNASPAPSVQCVAKRWCFCLKCPNSFETPRDTLSMTLKWYFSGDGGWAEGERCAAENWLRIWTNRKDARVLAVAVSVGRLFQSTSVREENENLRRSKEGDRVLGLFMIRLVCLDSGVYRDEVVVEFLQWHSLQPSFFRVPGGRAIRGPGLSGPRSM